MLLFEIFLRVNTVKIIDFLCIMPVFSQLSDVLLLFFVCLNGG